MNVLIACEYSGTVRDAFTKLGHNACSLDILDTESPGCHHKAPVEVVKDVFPGKYWDLIIFHPPCTAMALSGNRWYGKGMPRHQERLESLAWTKQQVQNLLTCTDRLCVENPASVLFKHLGCSVQYVQPYQFGHPEQKKTGLGLYNLPPLHSTNDVYSDMMKLPVKERNRIHYMSPGKDRGKERSKFYTGIADAMALQWGALNG